MRHDMFTSVELGMADRMLDRVAKADPWWGGGLDYEALVRFWCSDLACVPFVLRGAGDRRGTSECWEVLTPRGRRVALGRTYDGAWRLALAAIHYYLLRERERRVAA